MQLHDFGTRNLVTQTALHGLMSKCVPLDAREALANEIQDAISTNHTAPIQPEQLAAWQSQLFALRRDAPRVP